MKSDIQNNLKLALISKISSLTKEMVVELCLDLYLLSRSDFMSYDPYTQNKIESKFLCFSNLSNNERRNYELRRLVNNL